MNTPAHHLFSYINGDESVCMTTTAESLPEVLEKFGEYLRGCGYYFDGEVTICTADDCPEREGIPQEVADLNPSEDKP